MRPRVFIPTGFRTVDNTLAGIANVSLGGMGGTVVDSNHAIGRMVEDAVPDSAEELALSTLTYHNSKMSYLGAFFERGSSKLII